MQEHLVKSHLGGYYISDLSEAIITRTCEQCFDSDEILASWEIGDQEDRLNKIINVLNMNTILSKSDLLNYIEEDMSAIEIIGEVRNYIEYYTEDKKRLVNSISYDSRIDTNLVKQLKYYINNSLKEQLEFIRNFDYNELLNPKIKKIKYNKKHDN